MTKDEIMDHRDFLKAIGKLEREAMMLNIGQQLVATMLNQDIERAYNAGTLNSAQQQVLDDALSRA